MNQHTTDAARNRAAEHATAPGPAGAAQDARERRAREHTRADPFAVGQHRSSRPRKASKVFARAGGTLEIGGELPVHRLGFDAKGLSGPGAWGAPDDLDGAVRLLRRVREMGVTFIDTADAYGPHVSERLIRRALHPFDDIVVATKGGMTRTGPDGWAPLGRPEFLRHSVLMSLDRLGLERIDLWQLHGIDPNVPRDEQFDAMRQLQEEGLVRHLGLCDVGLDDLRAAQRSFEVATVQNRFNLVDRGSEEVLEACERDGIVFIPRSPLDAGQLAREEGVLGRIAQEVEVTPAQVALAWLLHRTPATLPIPGTTRTLHLEQNVGATALDLSDEDVDALDRQGRTFWRDRGQGSAGDGPQARA